MRPSADATRSASHPLAAKVPEITALFWVVKVLTTGTGEAASDYLAATSIGDHQQVPIPGNIGGDGVQAAHAVHRHAQRVAE